jgi:hypothetical protein
MSDDASGGWLRSIFRRSHSEAPQAALAEAAPVSPAAAPLAIAEPPAPAALTGEGPPLPNASSIVSYFHLQSTQWRFLALEDGATELGAQAAPQAAQALVAIVPDAQPHLCLLAVQDGRSFHIAGDTLTGPGIPARILRSSTRGIVRLQQPLSGLRFLTLEEPDAEDPALGVPRFNGPGNAVAAAFRMLPLEVEGVSAPLRAIGEEFGAAISAGLRQREVVSTLRRNWVRPLLAEALLRLLPPDELDDLSRRLLDEPQTLALIRRLLPDDPYVHAALPALIAWRASRAPVEPDGQMRFAGKDETLILGSANEAGVSPGLALLGLARGHVAPRKDFCILAPARNEGPYLLEWIAYHRSIGFEHFFIYTNDNSDGSEKLLAQLARHGVITLVHNDRGQRIGVQEKATAHGLSLLPQTLDYRWTAVMDLDEYIVFDTNVYDSIGDLMALHEAQPVDAVALCWVIFVSRFGEPYRRGLTRERFPWRANDVNRHVKSIFRTRRFWGSQPHYPHPTLDKSFVFRTEDGSPHHHPGVLDRIPAFAETPRAVHGWINHYIFRSAPEALWKLARGDVSWKPHQDLSERPLMENFVTRAFSDFAASHTLIRDTRIDSCAKGQQAELEKLLALPGVAELDDSIRFDFEVKLGQLAENFLAAPVPDNPPPSLLQFREALARSQGLTPIPVVQPARSAMV